MKTNSKIITENIYSIGGLLWRIELYSKDQTPADYGFWKNIKYIPYCWQKHRLKMTSRNAREFYCDNCRKNYAMSFTGNDVIDFISKEIESSYLDALDLIDIDGTLTPVKKIKEDNLDDGYYLVGQVSRSSRSTQVVLYAGKKGEHDKCQIFITPEERRLSFDQHDISPQDLLSKITVEFRDGSISTIQSNKQGHDSGSNE